MYVRDSRWTRSETIAVPFGTALIFFRALNLSFTNPASPLDALAHSWAYCASKPEKNRSKLFLQPFLVKNGPGTVQDRSLPQKTGQDRSLPQNTGQDRSLPQKTGQERSRTGPYLKKPVENGPGPVPASKTGQERSGTGPCLKIPVRIGPGPVPASKTGQERSGTGPCLKIPVENGPGPVPASKYQTLALTLPLTLTPNVPASKKPVRNGPGPVPASKYRSGTVRDRSGSCLKKKTDRKRSGASRALNSED